MRFLITGGAGFIGSHLAERLLLEGEVVVLDNLSTGSLRNIESLEAHPRFQFVQGSILDKPLVDKLVASTDVVVHLAAAVGVRKILADPIEAINVNVDGTQTILNASLRYGRKTLIASTSEVYGKNASDSLCETADSVLGTPSRWSYATAKKLDEFLALSYHQQAGLPVIVTRFFNIVGPRQTGRYGMVLPNFVRAALAGSPIRVFGNGRQTRNFTAVSDCIDAVARLLSEPKAYGEIFNIGGLVQLPIKDLAEKVKRLTNSSSDVVFVPYEEAYPEGGYEDMQARVPCICKIQRVTGWTPRKSVDEAILATAEYELRRKQLPFQKKAAPVNSQVFAFGD